jgi:hypothetical protein
VGIVEYSLASVRLTISALFGSAWLPGRLKKDQTFSAGELQKFISSVRILQAIGLAALGDQELSSLTGSYFPRLLEDKFVEFRRLNLSCAVALVTTHIQKGISPISCSD